MNTRATVQAISCMAALAAALAAIVFIGAALVTPVTQAQAAQPSLYTWKEKVAPDYVAQLGKAKGAAKAPARGKIKYSKLDKLGRTRTAKGTITYKMVKRAAARGRLDIPYEMKPSGWRYNPVVTFVLGDGTKNSDYFWNRSHLIADSLGGKVTKRNLITGTRMQNVGVYEDCGGMAYCETLVRTWLYRHHKGSVYYSAKPVYKGKELVARSVIVDIRTSDGSIDKRFVVYNAARGYKVKYAKGGFRTTGKTPGKLKLPAPSGNTNVYVTPTGARYHSSGLCEGLVFASKVSKTTCAHAREDGLTACTLCCSR